MVKSRVAHDVDGLVTFGSVLPFGPDGVQGWGWRLLLAGVLDGLLVLVLAFWLWSFSRPFPVTAGPLRRVSLYWVRAVPQPVAIPPRQTQKRERASRVVAQPRIVPLPLRGEDVLGRMMERARPRARGLLQRLSAPGSGSGLPRSIAVDIPIPGGGGLPATPYEVKQLSLGEPPPEEPGPPGNLWIYGEVNRAGRVVRDEVLQTAVNLGQTRAAVAFVKRWRFAPLVLRGHRSGFHIVVDGWWTLPWQGNPVVHLHHPLYPSSSALGGYEELPSSMHWILYPIPGHRPLAVLVAMGRYPLLNVAQATAWAILRIEGEFRGGEVP